MNKEEIYGAPLSIILIVLSGWILFGLLSASLFVLFSALSLYNTVFFALGISLIGLFIALATIFSIIVAVSFIRRKDIFSFLPTRNIWMKYFVPVARSVAKRIVLLDPDKAVRTYIVYNNSFVMDKIKDKKISNILMLLPHCLQLHSCGMKLTSDVRNCKKCGKCVVSGFIELSDQYGVDIFIASGGTTARRQIVSSRPDLIIAVACERDLLSGIRDTLPLPVVGVFNERPEGPCVNTTVDIKQIAEIIDNIKKPH